MNEKFKGLYAATIVPLKKNRQINIIELKNHLKDIVNKKNIKGLLINGHAGENFSLTDKEQIVIVKIAKKIIKKNQLIVSGVNFEDPYKARVVAKEMEKNGADAILIFPPFSWSFSRSQDQIFDHHKIIHDFISIPIFSFATARLKYCLKKMKKISTDFMRSTIELDSNDKKNLDKILSKFKLINY